MGRKNWDLGVQRMEQLLSSLTDEQLLQEIVPGKNRGIYLVGHLLAHHDNLNTLLGLGPRLHPELDEAFMHHPDRSGLPMPAVRTLRQYWPEVHAHLASQFQQLTPAAWFSRHGTVSEEDFQREPFRNKLNMLLNRTSHISLHMGQLRLLT